MNSEVTNLFKPYIVGTQAYVGGSTRSVTKDDKKIYKLSSNENLLGPSPKAINAIKNNLHNLYEYQYQDDACLLEALACHFDYTIEREQFITANSGMELLDLICRGFLEPGDDCILSTPTFLAYKNFAQLAGATVKDVPLCEKDFSLPVYQILDAVTEKTKLIFISSPNNPTGALVTKSDMDALLDGLPAHVVIVYDEVYYHYVSSPAYARAMHYVKEKRRVIGMHSFSKAYGLAGIRLGYAFSTPDIARYLRQLRRPFMINTLTMEAGIAALSDYDHINRTVELIEKEKMWMYDALLHAGLPYWPSHANFVLFRPPYEAGQFAADMLQAGVMVRTGDPFGAKGYIRVTIGTREANMAFANGLKRLL